MDVGNPNPPTPPPAPTPVPAPTPAEPPVPAPHPDLTRPPAGPNDVVAIPPARLAALLDAEKRLAAKEAEAAAAVEAERRKTVEAQAAAGQIKEAFDAERAAAKERENTLIAERDRIENERLSDRKAATLAGLLAAAPFVSEAAAADARALLDLQTEVVREGDQIVVRDRASKRPVGDVVRDWLSSDRAAHYLKPSTKGGAGAKGGDATPPVEPPKTWAEAAIAHERANRMAPGKAYGLRYTPPLPSN